MLMLSSGWRGPTPRDSVVPTPGLALSQGWRGPHPHVDVVLGLAWPHPRAGVVPTTGLSLSPGWRGPHRHVDVAIGLAWPHLPGWRGPHPRAVVVPGLAWSPPPPPTPPTPPPLPGWRCPHLGLAWPDHHSAAAAWESTGQDGGFRSFLPTRYCWRLIYCVSDRTRLRRAHCSALLNFSMNWLTIYVPPNHYILYIIVL